MSARDTYLRLFVSDIAIFVLKRDVKLQLTNYLRFLFSSVYSVTDYTETANGDKLVEYVKHHILRVVIKAHHVRAPMQMS